MSFINPSTRRTFFPVPIPLLALLAVWPTLSAYGDAEVRLAPIIKEGAPADALSDDPILPAMGSRQDPGKGGYSSGSMHQGIQDEIALPVNSTNAAGALSQFQGVGRSSEDNDVQAFGIPLNPAQGGGFDFSVFPAFLWAGYRYQVGPSLGAFDPRGVAGTVTLTPWTQLALQRGAAPSRVSALGSGASLGQFAAGAASGTDVAALAGFSVGDLSGPSGSISAQKRFDRWTGRVHLLATDVEAVSPGSRSFPTPQARQFTTRLVPVAQADVDLPGASLLKTSAFYDGTDLHYTDPGSSFETHDRIQQLGLENALLWDDWKLGASGRYVIYHKLDFDAPNEAVVNLQATRSFEKGSLLVEPTLQGVGVTRFGVLPQGSLGARYEVADRTDVFARASYTRRFPSLTDRYYVIPFAYSGNPGLQAERDWTGTVGIEIGNADFGATLEGYAQLRDDAQVAVKSGSVSSLANLGQATIASFLARSYWRVASWLSFDDSLGLTHSNLSVTDTPFPGMPDASYVVTADVHSPGDQPLWQGRATARFVSPATSDASGNRVSAHSTADVDLNYRILRTGIVATARLDNVFDTIYELIPDFPVRGRTISLQLTGEF